MNDFLEQASGLLERRFLKNAFLPVLLLPLAIAAPAGFQNDRSAHLAAIWKNESATVQLLQLAVGLALVWFVAAILASQWRNIIRLFEGYPLMRVPWLGAACARWYWRRRQEVAGREDNWQLYYYFPTIEEDCLPTRLGNVLRAAERYPYSRYGADSIILWPRLSHVVERQVLDDVEDARALLEFLLVISLWFATAGLAGGSLVLGLGGSPVLAVAWSVGGILAAYLAYVSAIWSAVEYGEQLRTSMELFRLALFEQLRIDTPTNLQEEREAWSRLEDLVRDNLIEDLSKPYATVSAPS